MSEIDEHLSTAVPSLDHYNEMQRQAYFLLEDRHDNLRLDTVISVAFNDSLCLETEDLRAVLHDTGRTPLDLHRKLVSLYFVDQERLVELLHAAYERARGAAKAGPQYGEFDCAYFRNFQEALGLFVGIGACPDPVYTIDREEIFCDVAYFYRLMDLEAATACYEIPRRSGRALTPNLMSGLFGDALLGYMRREDLVDKEDRGAVTWAKGTVEGLGGGASFAATGHMLQASLRLRGRLPGPLLDKFLGAMITVRLSAVLLHTTGKSKPWHLYAHLRNHDIPDEQFFAAGTKKHSLIVSFKHREGTNRADIAYINSGNGLYRHPHKSLFASQHTETTPVHNVDYITRYVPFAIYEDRPDELFVRHGGNVDSLDELYFRGTPNNATEKYADWQYVDDQRAGTCYAIMYWYLPYWLERGSQLEVEVLKLGPQRELLCAALEDFGITIDAMNNAVLTDKGKSLLEELSKVFRLKRIFISFGLNEALQAIGRLHLRGFDMTSIMDDYKSMWDEYSGRRIWGFIESNAVDMYVHVHNLILKGALPLERRKPLELSGGVLEALRDARHSGSAYEFTKAAMAALMGEMGHRGEIQDVIIEGAKTLGLEDHHKALIFEVASREQFPSFLKRLYKEGMFAMAKEAVDVGALINYEDLPAVTDDELRIAAVQYQGEHERSRGLIRLLGPVEGKDPFAFTKAAVKAILEGNTLLQDFVIDGAMRFGQFEAWQRLRPHHMALILWAVADKGNHSLIRKLCLSGPSFPLIFQSGASSSDREHTVGDAITASSDDELLKIATWANVRETIVARIIRAAGKGKLERDLRRKLREEIRQAGR